MALKLEQLQKAFLDKCAEKFNPVAAGIMPPRTAPTTKRKRGKTRIKESEGGSADLRGLAADARKTANSAKAATEGKQARKEARAKKKADTAEELSRRRAAYEACKAKCVCGKAPCPFAGLVLCTVCGDMKKAECRKQKCKAAKAAPAGPVAVVDRAPRSPGRKQGCGSHLPSGRSWQTIN